MLQYFLVVACSDYVETLQRNHQTCHSLVNSYGCDGDMTLRLSAMSGKVKSFCPAFCDDVALTNCNGR